MSASATYTFTNEGSQNTNLGDSFKYNFGLSYAAHSYFDLVLEFTGEWREKEIRANEIIGNSGGRHLYVAPGIRFQSRNDWTASVSYGVPISEHLNGYQSAPDSRLFGSLSFNF